MVDYHRYSKEELINELRHLEQKYHSSLSFYEKENDAIKHLNNALIAAKEKAEESERNFKLIFESTGTANAVFDTDCKLILQNKLSVKSLGRDATGLSVFDLFGEELGEAVYKRMKRVIDTGKSETFETEFELPVGLTWFRSYYQPVFDEHKNVVSVQVISQNINEIKKAELELVKAMKLAEENEKKFRNLVWDMRVGVLLQGPKAEMLLWNPAALKLLGLTEEQLMGKTSFDPYWNVIHEDGSPFPGHTHPVPVAIAERHSVRNVVMGVQRYAKKDRVWLLVDAIPQFDDMGEVSQVVCTFIDITEQKKMLEALRESEAKLKELNATKDKFFSIIAHDLKSPFNSILGFSQLLVEQTRDEGLDNIGRYAEIILHSSQKALDLLMNLMEWSRTQTGKIEFNPSYFDLADLVKEVKQLFNVTAEQKSIHISLVLPSQYMVYADQAMISTVLRNLISNAVKFTMPEGEINVAIEEKKSKFMISVTDTGTGIAKENVKKLFQIDENYTMPGTMNEKGTGLGLILCKEFVEKHGGEISVKSKEGEGSTFYFTIPRKLVFEKNSSDSNFLLEEDNSTTV